MNKERLLVGTGNSDTRPSTFRAVEPLNEPSFISADKGFQYVEVTPGAYACQLQDLTAQQYALRFFVDFPKGAVRNDVTLPAERVYFMTTCWIQNDGTLQRAQQRQDELQQALKATEHKLLLLAQQAQAGFSLEALQAKRQVTTLTGKCQKIATQLTQLDETNPLQSQNTVEGPNGLVFAKEGIIAVKRFRGAMETREQYHWIGTFALQEFFEDLEEKRGRRRGIDKLSNKASMMGEHCSHDMHTTLLES